MPQAFRLMPSRFALLGLLALGACADLPELPSLGGGMAREPAARPAVAVAPPPVAQSADPVVAFLAAGGNGGGYRLARSYTAASGRDCREVLMGSGGDERSVVYCRAGEGWVAARPLLRGGTSRQ
jgi:hypothetical protein